MDPNYCAMFAQRAMRNRNFEEALHFLNMILVQLPSQRAAPFLHQRAHCFWELGEFGASLQDMTDAIRAGLPGNGQNAETESQRWTNRAHFLYQRGDYTLAERCATVALHFRPFPPKLRAQTFLCRAITRYEMGNTSGTQRDINETKKMDSELARDSALLQKDFAIKELQQKHYEKSMKLLCLALMLHPQNGSDWVKFKRSVESHRAAAYFNLKRYKEALQVGEESHQENPSDKLTDEAKRWKERGNKLSKEPNLVDLAIGYYSLALNYTPTREKELKAAILSNRSLMYKKKEQDEEALRDAKECVENKPNWAKAQYRLGSCLSACKKYDEAMEPFTKSLKLLLEDSSSKENDKVDTLNQLLSVALTQPDSTSGIPYSVPQNVTQKLIDRVIAEKDWERLYLLFMGGGGERRFKKGAGGLGTGCDASGVPLEDVIRCDFPDLCAFVRILLDHKAIGDSPKGGKGPVDVAIELGKFEVASVLLDRNTESGPGLHSNTSKSSRGSQFRAEGEEALLKGDVAGATQLLELALKDRDCTVDQRRETLQRLCVLYFEQKLFNECLVTGRKLRATYRGQEKEIKQAKQWKTWGNDLHKESKYDLMADYYSLAMEFTPLSSSDIMTALLSNRCLAFIHLKKLNKALADAEKCIEIKPQWFRGHSRHGNCLLQLKRHKEAMKAFCKAHTYASDDREKNATAGEVVSTAMEIEFEDGDSQIACTFSPDVLQFLVKEASEKSEWNKLTFLYLGSKSSKTSQGIAFQCDASSVPLNLLIESDIKDLPRLLTLLLERGAPPDGLRDCTRPPLLTAMELMKFPLAVTLLRKNADPSCVVGQGIFINREGQPKQWLQLGRKALENNDYKKATMLLNMCLHLSDSSTDLSILTQVYQGLAESHFQQNEHERAIDAGKECFKRRPVKSEEEAKKCQVRASKVFEQGSYSYCKEYVNLALKYTPPDSKSTYSLLLCQRSEAEQHLGEYTNGLEDAKKAAMMTPEMLEGHLNQVNCLRALKRQREAMEAINECLKRTTDENLMSRLLSDAIDNAATLQEGTSTLTAPVQSHLITKLTNDVIARKDWNKLRILYLGGGGSQLKGDGGLATNVDASRVPLGEVIRHFGSRQPQLISALLENGASANGIEGSDLTPLDEAIRQESHPLVEKLVQHGANCCVASSDGEPIVHKALKKSFQRGNFRFLEVMMKSKPPEIESVQDSNGDTLYHLVSTGRKSIKQKCDAIRILRNANVNPNLPNKSGKRPIDMLYKSDARWKKVNNAIKCYESATPTQACSEKNQEHVPSKEEDEHISLTEDAKDEDGSVNSESDPLPAEPSTLPKDVKLKKVDEKQRQRNEIRATIEGLINDLPLQSTEPAEETETHDVFDEDTVASNIMEQDDNALNEEVTLNSTEGESTRADVMGDVVAEREHFADDETDTQIDLQSPFEDLPWEVDCTDRVWRAMRSRKVDNNLRKRIINKIRMLANGRWSKTLCKRLEGEAKKAGIQLYESKLTKGQRIIWERTIAFSGRLSDRPELRLNTENPGGRIYTDIIRVWDIVLDHDKLKRAIENIVKSHDRGMDCLIKKKLKGFTVESHSDSPLSSECLPNKYAELADLNQVPTPVAKKEVLTKPPTSECLSQIFYPPASENDQEYHILKFYTFSTPLVKTVLESDTSARVDFPFKITELEHAIVNLQPDPLTPIILLGRSGTGKTTCCLYRLWDRFQHYWESAVAAGPHIQKYVPPRDNTSRSDEEEDQQRSREGKACGPERSSASLTSECQEFEACTEPVIASNLAHIREESQVYSNCSYPPPSTQEQQPEQNDAEDVDSRPTYEHLHQIFITKNTVLCSEVEKNFKELCRACPSAEHRLKFEDQLIPTKIQDVHEHQWPLFVNSRDWLLTLDASIPGKSFFKRAPDGSLLRKIEGWGEEDNHLQFIPTTELDESDDEEGEELTATEKEEEVLTTRGKEPKEERDPRKEIAYQTFLTELWPKMKKTSKVKIDFHPTLVWTEIRSFIKGSAEALLSEKGILSLEDYESLGKKKAPNFTADRKVVYDLFLVYQRVRSSNRMFDEADLVFNIHQRLQRISAPEWSVHQFYVDETQDFTQAELSLLIRCCRFPNYLFFTGDTAQSIMRGIAFRFDDLKTLFHHAKEAAGIKGEHHDFIRVPKKLYQLTHNYRSHAGILRLASSVVDLLLDCFPESFDRLQKDEGLFDGPKPVLLESCSPTDLAMILQGNQRQSSRIEFGAHQVVLVVSNEARETMPDELKQGLVMTIYEAKGLEFDDVLIYNFFKDSQAGKEWRVVTSFAENQSQANVSISNGIVEITEDNVATNRPRPLEFDPGKHKVLNSEFKFLYTAITRARVNVWFFDEDKEARTPVFDYFRRRGLVKVVSLSDEEQGTGELTSMFAAKSTPEEWQKGGMRFYKKRLWVPAIQCFTFAGDTLMLQKSKAQQLAAEAIKLRYTNRQQMRDEFLKAGESFLQCGMHGEGAICLHNSQEWILLAKLYQKTGKFADAAKLFKKKGWFNEASRCYESQNNYCDAIETLCKAGHFDEALGALERFNILCSSGDPESRQGIIPPGSTRTTERLRHQLADQHFKRGNIKEMEQVLQYLPSATDRITFLKKRGCIIEAARAMEKAGRRDEAAGFLRDTGRFQEAVRFSSDPKFVADCFMFQAHTTEITEDTQRILGSAIEKYKLCDDLNGQAEAYLMLGKISANVPNIQAAGKLFDKCKNCCGEAESVAELLEVTKCSPPERFGQWIAVRALERLLRLVGLLYKPVTQLSMLDKNEIKKCEEHFGLFTTDIAHSRVYFCRLGGRFSKVDPDFVKSNAGKTEAAIDVAEAHRKIACFLIDVSVSLKEMISKMLEKTFRRNSVCREAAGGPERTPCATSSCEHQKEDSGEYFNNRFRALFNFIYLESVVEQGILDTSLNKSGSNISPLNDKDFKEFHACQRFYKFLFPSCGYRRYNLTLPQIQSVRITKAVKRRIAQFSSFLWKETAQHKRRSDTNNFLKVSSSLQLIDSVPEMVRWICEEENEFQKQGRASRVANDQLVKNGMVFQSHSGLCESYLHWWEDGKKRLYVYGEVESAAHLIVRRFLTLTAKRSRMIYPSIANTVMIIEHQMTACLALYTRLCLEHRYPICLPASYLTMVRFWDNFRPGAETNTFTMYQAIEHNVSQEKDKRRLTSAVCSILNYLVRLTCGVEARSFDVLGDALTSESTPVEEAERTLILILTMLCNCGKAMSRTSEEILLRKIFTLNLDPRLPNHILKVFEGIQEAKGYVDVVALLQKFLQSRGEDLYDLRWHNGKLWQDGPSNPMWHPQEFCADLSKIREELDLEKQQLKEEEPEDNDAPGSHYMDSERADPDTTAGDMEVQYTEEELKEKEEARKDVFARTLQRWYKRIKFAEKICLFAEYLKSRKISRLISIEERMKSKASSDGSEEHFSLFKVDSTACGICGTHFRTSTDEDSSVGHVGNEGDFEASNQPVQEMTQDKRIESAEAHQKSREHLKKEQEFQQYKEFYLTEIHPCLMKEDELLKMVENTTSSGEKRRVESVKLDMERLERCSSSVKRKCQHIEYYLKWNHTESLWTTVKEFKTELQRTVKVFEQAKTEPLTDEHEEEEEIEEGKDRNEEDDKEEQLVDMNETKRRKRDKPNKRQRKN